LLKARRAAARALTARTPGRDAADTNPYLRKLTARSPCAPVLAIAVASRLDYPRYHWFDRAIIRAIIRLTGGPTDPRTSVVHSAWDASTLSRHGSPTRVGTQDNLGCPHTRQSRGRSPIRRINVLISINRLAPRRTMRVAELRNAWIRA
jgi:hypothetical protein